MGFPNDKEYLLMSDTEVADILGFKGKSKCVKLYKICDFFDAKTDDAWELIEGEHFEWVNKASKKRRFYEAGVIAIAKYLQETKKGLVETLVDTIYESLTHRKQRMRRLLVRRHVSLTLQDTNAIRTSGNLVFVNRPYVIQILKTNGKGLTAAARREQLNAGLLGREPLEKGIHFDDRDNIEQWSQRGIARIAQNMSENFNKNKNSEASKSRKAWVDAIAESVEDAIADQRKHLESFDQRIEKAKNQAKAVVKYTCQVTLQRKKPGQEFNLCAHHLFDKATRPDLAALHENLLVIHEDVHKGFHSWHGHKCEPRNFIDYLTSIESWRFDTPKKEAHLQQLINRLNEVQQRYKDHLVVDK